MSYVLIIGTVLLGLFSLHKDWHNYKHPWVRKAVPLVLVIVGVLSIIKSYRDSRDAQSAKAKAIAAVNTLQAEIAGLHSQVKAANDAQTQNTKVFLETLNRLSDKVRDLQTKVENEDLRKQLAGVQSDLQKTQKAMAPGPKASLTFSFVPFINPPQGYGHPSPVTEISLPVASDGTAHFDFSIINFTDVSAVNIEVTLIICDRCKFAKEPQGYSRLPGETETQRHRSIDFILPMVNYQTQGVDIMPPTDLDTFDVGIVYRCLTCAVLTGPCKGTVHLNR